MNLNSDYSYEEQIKEMTSILHPQKNNEKCTWTLNDKFDKLVDQLYQKSLFFIS